MDQTLDDVIKKQLAIIPPRVREALLHIDSSKYIQVLAEKHHLRIDQGGVLEKEVLLIMLGLESPSVFMNNLIREGHVPPSVAAAIAQDINRDVFDKIRHDLVGFLEQGRDEFEEKKPEESQGPAETIPPQQQTPPPFVIKPQTPAPQTPAVQKNTAPLSGAGFTKEKMEGAFRMPAETTRIGETSAQTSPAKPPYTDIDPYREPVK